MNMQNIFLQIIFHISNTLHYMVMGKIFHHNTRFGIFADGGLFFPLYLLSHATCIFAGGSIGGLIASKS